MPRMYASMRTAQLATNATPQVRLGGRRCTYTLGLGCNPLWTTKQSGSVYDFTEVNCTTIEPYFNCKTISHHIASL